MGNAISHDHGFRESKCTENLELLYSLLSEDLEYMVYLALGDAITRLESESNFNLLISSIKNDQKAIFEGSVRAIAMLHLIPINNIIEQVIAFAIKNENVKFWVAVASAVGILSL